jgi:hypothetical protein
MYRSISPTVEETMEHWLLAAAYDALPILNGSDDLASELDLVSYSAAGADLGTT